MPESLSSSEGGLIMKTRVLVFVLGSAALFGCATRQVPEEPFNARLAEYREYRTAGVSAESRGDAIDAITVNPEQVFGN